ncbi:hypothetical protein Pan44_00240 [Caulifigura coniformis]|uniref:Uncharacterized protein n=1 Tax=Caulifigura coniformis TaxID=2527983 RepID=A0A517S7C2_9PLAN|nr:hypothetical protein [Caulifigura coniformis]QDT52017.1 hypothetical protein Pan44_00240 [Caulifigura coniformis]
MSSRRRRLVQVFAAIVAILLLAGGFAWRLATARPLIESVPLSTGQFNVRFLKADLGTLNYSSDDNLRAFLRRRIPGPLVKKLGEVTTVRGYTPSHQEFGGPPLVLLFQLLTPQNALQTTTSTVFGKIEFPESTGFVFTDEINGYNSHGEGTSLHDFTAFPRREPQLHFRLYEQNGQMLMEKSMANPGYRTDFPVWTPDALPQTTSVEPITVTLRSLKVDVKNRHLGPIADVASDDPSWLNPERSYQWTDATGNSGSWLSPFEPAWKLHLRYRRRRDAEFPASATWTADPVAVPVGLTVTRTAQSAVVDEIEFRIRYVAPAGELEHIGDTITVTPPRSPGHTGLSVGAGSRPGPGGGQVPYESIEAGVPFIRVDHDPLPTGVQALYDVIDDQGNVINDKLFPGGGGVHNTQFAAVYFPAEVKTKKVTLKLRVSRPRDVEFLVAPPAELREAIQNRPAGKDASK